MARAVERRRAAPCPRSPTRRRGGSRRAPRTSAARDGGRTGPAPTRPAGTSRDAVDVVAPRAVRVAPARVQVQPDAGPRRPPTARAAPSSGTRRRPARRPPRGSPGTRRASCPPRGRHEQEVGARVRGVAREELGLPGARRDHAGRAPFARLQRGHSAWPFAGSVAAAGAHRPHVIGMPAGPQRLAARRAASSRGEEERHPSGGAEATRGHRRSLAPLPHGADRSDVERWALVAWERHGRPLADVALGAR